MLAPGRWSQGRLHAGAVDVGLAAAGAPQGAVAVGADMQMPGIVVAGDRPADGAPPADGGLAALGAQQGCGCLHRSVPFPHRRVLNAGRGRPKTAAPVGAAPASMLGDDPRSANWVVTPVSTRVLTSLSLSRRSSSVPARALTPACPRPAHQAQGPPARRTAIPRCPPPTGPGRARRGGGQVHLSAEHRCCVCAGNPARRVERRAVTQRDPPNSVRSHR
jgi:hypothetical protein